MSYVRLGVDGSDVYVYASASEEGGFECCNCSLNKTSVAIATEEAMIAHLAVHKRAGHCVPEYVITRLWNEIGAKKEE